MADRIIVPSAVDESSSVIFLRDGFGVGKFVLTNHMLSSPPVGEKPFAKGFDDQRRSGMFL